MAGARDAGSARHLSEAAAIMTAATPVDIHGSHELP
jgi:hypothetical protein